MGPNSHQDLCNLWAVHRTFSIERRRNCHSLYSRPILDIFSRSEDIRDQSLKWPKIDRNFACFWPPIFLGERPPNFLEWDYKIQPDSDHVAKFQGDRSRELGERVAKKKHLRQNISPSGTVVPGGLNWQHFMTAV